MNFQGIEFVDAPELEQVLNEVITEDCYHMDRIPDGSIVIDVGTFYGEFGLWMNLKKGCHVLAFEPSRNNFAIACENVTRSNADDIHLVHKAVAGFDGGVSFKDCEEHPGEVGQIQPGFLRRGMRVTGLCHG